MARASNRDNQPGNDFEPLRSVNDFRLDPRRGKKQVHDYAFFRLSWRKQPHCGQAPGCTLLDNFLNSVPSELQEMNELFGFLIGCHADTNINVPGKTRLGMSRNCQPA